MLSQLLKKYLPLLFKGMAMGAADAVPGVSGGTVALITGIYEELIDSIRRIDLSAIKVLFSEGIAAAWQHINGSFLLTVFSGVLISLLSLAQVIEYCLENFPILVWSAFFGLVSASIVHLARQLVHWNWRVIVGLIVGTVVSAVITIVKPAELPSEWWMFSIAGAIAICAMILPGISGSYILVLLGMYSTFMQALDISNLQWSLLFSFALGCGIGLLCFSHLLSWLLKSFHNETLAVLTGFLVGSLVLLWPWKVTVSTYLDRHGELAPLEQDNVLPWNFLEKVGMEPQIGSSLLLFGAGIILVLMLERLGKK